MGEKDYTEHRPWGYYTILAEEPDHKVKRVVVYPGKRLSMQRHRLRTEHWYVITGEGAVILDGASILLRPGDSLDIPRGAVHRLENTGTVGFAIVEVQTGEYFGEDDIERIEDDYGRS